MADTEQAENLSSNEDNAEELQPIEGAEVSVDDNASDAAGDEPEEFEIVLGSADEPSAEEKPKKKPKGIKRLLDKQRENKDEIAELRRENEALRNGALQTNTPANAIASMPIMPTEESAGYDPEVLRQAQAKYSQDISQYQRDQVSQVLDERENGTQRAREEQHRADSLNAHYDRADKLGLQDFGEAEGKLIEILGAEAVKQIAQVVPNSEMVVNYLGKNTDKAFDLLETWQNRGSSGALFALGVLSKDVKAVPKQRKRAPAPESKVTAAAPATKSSLEKSIEKERQAIQDGKTDFSDLMALKKQMASA